MEPQKHVKFSYDLAFNGVLGCIFMNNYLILRTIGQGRSGKVKLAYDLSTSRLCAIKVITKRPRVSPLAGKRRQSLCGGIGTSLTDELEREVRVMAHVSHPLIIQLYEVIDDPRDSRLLLVTEYADAGTLLPPRTADVEHRRVPEEQARVFFGDMARAVQHLHSQHVVHGDIKPDNFLLTSCSKVKLADLGSAVHVGPGHLQHHHLGTPAYTAPEVLGGDGYDGKAADMWSLGVCLYELLVGRGPFDSNSDIRTYSKVKKGHVEWPSDVSMSPAVQSLIKSLLKKDPSARPTASDLLRNRWVTGRVSLTRIGSALQARLSSVNLITSAKRIGRQAAQLARRDDQSEDLASVTASQRSVESSVSGRELGVSGKELSASGRDYGHRCPGFERSTGDAMEHCFDTQEIVLQPGEQLFQQGDAMQGTYFVQSGSMKSYVHSLRATQAVYDDDFQDIMAQARNRGVYGTTSMPNVTKPSGGLRSAFAQPLGGVLPKTVSAPITSMAGRGESELLGRLVEKEGGEGGGLLKAEGLGDGGLADVAAKWQIGSESEAWVREGRVQTTYSSSSSSGTSSRSIGSQGVSDDDGEPEDTLKVVAASETVSSVHGQSGSEGGLGFGDDPGAFMQPFKQAPPGGDEATEPRTTTPAAPAERVLSRQSSSDLRRSLAPRMNQLAHMLGAGEGLLSMQDRQGSIELGSCNDQLMHLKQTIPVDLWAKFIAAVLNAAARVTAPPVEWASRAGQGEGYGVVLMPGFAVGDGVYSSDTSPETVVAGPAGAVVGFIPRSQDWNAEQRAVLARATGASRSYVDQQRALMMLGSMATEVVGLSGLGTQPRALISSPRRRSGVKKGAGVWDSDLVPVVEARALVENGLVRLPSTRFRAMDQGIDVK